MFCWETTRAFQIQKYSHIIPYQWIISQLPSMDQPKQLVDKPGITGQWFNGCFWFWEHPDGFHGHLNHSWWWGQVPSCRVKSHLPMETRHQGASGCWYMPAGKPEADKYLQSTCELVRTKPTTKGRW